jgi:hypothetical protein
MTGRPNGKIYIHIGFHKTGTTSLQVHVFPKLENIQYLGRFHKNHKYGEDLYLNILKYCCASKVDLDLRNKIVVDLSVILNHDDILISDEWLTSNYDGLFYGDGAQWTEKQTRLRGLLEDFDTQILLCTRRPIEAAYSLYCEFKQIPYGARYETFKDFCENSFDVLIYISGKEFILQLWGYERVTCIEYEQLKENPSEFENTLKDYFEGRFIQQVLQENYRRSSNGFTEIKDRGVLFSRIKHIIRNSTVLSKLILENNIGNALVRLATFALEKKIKIQHLTQEQERDCLDVLKSRKISF